MSMRREARNQEKGRRVNRPPSSRSLCLRGWSALIFLCLQRHQWLPLPVALALWGCTEQTGPVLTDTPKVPTPDPVSPLPSPEQLAWQTQELTAFFHFGINTFSDKEQGDGTDNPMLFNPTGLDANQWM